MNLLMNLFSETCVRRLGWVLIHFLWEGMIIALVLAALLRLLTKASSHTRYAVAGIALLICAIAPAITWTMLAPLHRGSSPMTEIGLVNPPQPQDGILSPSSQLPTSPQAPMETGTAWHVRLVQAANASLPYAVGLWFVGVFILSTRLTLGWIWMKRLCRSSIPVKDPRCLEKFEGLLIRMQIDRPVRLLESALVEVPTLIGWLRPTILIPVSLFIGMTPDQLEAIFAHELAHVRRYDYVVNLLQTVIETILFYHPAIWWISRKLREERENCCDDIALEVMADRLVYVSALAQLEEGRAMPLALSASGGSLLHRIRRIAGVNDRKVSAWPLWVMIFGILSIACLTESKAIEPQVTASVSTTPMSSAKGKEKGSEPISTAEIVDGTTEEVLYHQSSAGTSMNLGEIRASACLLVDGTTGKVLYERNADEPHLPANLVQLMTCLLAYQSFKPDQKIVVQPEDIKPSPRIILFSTGETVSVDTLLHAVLIESDNDAASILARDVAGNPGSFVDRMNQRAAELGCFTTHYTSPSSNSSKGDYTSCRDLLRIFRVLVSYPELRSICSLPTYAITTQAGPHVLYNHNRLLGLYPGMGPAQTGWSEASRHTYAAAVDRILPDGKKHELILTLMDSPDKWHDSVILFNYGFDSLVNGKAKSGH